MTGADAKLLEEIQALKQQIAALEKRDLFFNALQKHYEEEKAYIALVEKKINDLYITIQEKNSSLDALHSALQLFKIEDGQSLMDTSDS